MNIIKKIRLAVGYTQYEFAQKVFKSEKTISSYEQGVRQPTFEFIEQIIKQFNLKLTMENEIKIERKKFMNSTINLEMNKKILNFMVETRDKKYYIESDFAKTFISFKECIDKYRSLVSDVILSEISSHSIRTENIKGFLSNDGNLIFYFINSICAVEIYNSAYRQKLISENDLQLIHENCDVIYDNPMYTRESFGTLWLFMLQKDIEQITKDQIRESLTSYFQYINYSSIDTRFCLIQNEIKDWLADERLLKEEIKIICIDNFNEMIEYDETVEEFFKECNIPYSVTEIDSDKICMILDDLYVVPML